MRKTNSFHRTLSSLLAAALTFGSAAPSFALRPQEPAEQQGGLEELKEKLLKVARATGFPLPEASSRLVRPERVEGRGLSASGLEEKEAEPRTDRIAQQGGAQAGLEEWGPGPDFRLYPDPKENRDNRSVIYRFSLRGDQLWMTLLEQPVAAKAKVGFVLTDSQENRISQADSVVYRVSVLEKIIRDAEAGDLLLKGAWDEIWLPDQGRLDFKNPKTVQALKSPPVLQALAGNKETILLKERDLRAGEEPGLLVLTLELDKESAVVFHTAGDDPSGWSPFAEIAVIKRESSNTRFLFSSLRGVIIDRENPFRERQTSSADPAAGLEEGIQLGVADRFMAGDILVDDRGTGKRRFVVTADQKSTVDSVSIQGIDENGKRVGEPKEVPAQIDFKLRFHAVRELVNTFSRHETHPDVALRPVTLAPPPGGVLLLQWASEVPTEGNSRFALVRVPKAEDRSAGIQVLDQLEKQFQLQGFSAAGLQGLSGMEVPYLIRVTAPWETAGKKGNEVAVASPESIALQWNPANGSLQVQNLPIGYVLLAHRLDISPEAAAALVTAGLEESGIGSLPSTHQIDTQFTGQFLSGRVPTEEDAAHLLGTQGTPHAQLATEWIGVVTVFEDLIGAGRGLDTVQKRGIVDRSDIRAQEIQDQVALARGIRLQHVNFETKGLTPGGLQAGAVGGDPKGKLTPTISDVIEHTAAFVEGAPGASSMQMEGPGAEMFGSFPDEARALMVVTHTDPAKEAAVLRQHGVQTVDELLDPELPVDQLVRRVAELNGVHSDQVDVTLLTNDNADMKALRNLQKTYTGLQVHRMTAGTVVPALAAVLGVNDGRVRLFLRRSGMTEGVFITLLADLYSADGSYANFRVVSEEIKSGFGRRYIWNQRVLEQMKALRPDDWEKIRDGKKIFSSRQATPTLPVTAAYTFLTNGRTDLDLPFSVDGVRQDGNASTISTLVFTSNPAQNGAGYLWLSRNSYPLPVPEVHQAGLEESVAVREARSELNSIDLQIAAAERNGEESLLGVLDIARIDAGNHLGAALAAQAASQQRIPEASEERLKTAQEQFSRTTKFWAPARAEVQPRAVVVDLSRDERLSQLAWALSIMRVKQEDRSPEFRVVIQSGSVTRLLKQWYTLDRQAVWELTQRIVAYNSGENSADAVLRAQQDLERKGFNSLNGSIQVISELSKDLAESLRTFFTAGGLNFVNDEAFDRLQALFESA